MISHRGLTPVLDVRLAQILVEPALERYREAIEVSNRAVQTFSELSKEDTNFVRPFSSHHKALLARAYVKGVSYYQGNVPVEFVVEADKDARKVLKETRLSGNTHHRYGHSTWLSCRALFL